MFYARMQDTADTDDILKPRMDDFYMYAVELHMMGGAGFIVIQYVSKHS